MFREAPADRIEKIYASKAFLRMRHTLGYWKKNWPSVERPAGAGVRPGVCCFVGYQDALGCPCLVRQYRYGLDDLYRNHLPCVMVLENLQDRQSGHHSAGGRRRRESPVCS